MICVTAFYPAAGDGRFDKTYYFEKHFPLLQRLLPPFGLIRMEADEGVAGFAPGMPPNYKFIARLYFESIDGFQEAISAVGGEIFADISNYTDIPVEIQVSQTTTF
jgi:uncharacterized protein (TIGR02118 family)